MAQVTKITWEVSGYIDAPIYEPEPSIFKKVIQKLGGIIKGII